MLKRSNVSTNVHVSIMFQNKRLVESQNSDRKLVLMGRLPSCLSPGSLLSLCPPMVFLRQKRSKLSQVSS